MKGEAIGILNRIKQLESENQILLNVLRELYHTSAPMTAHSNIRDRFYKAMNKAAELLKELED